MAAQASSTLAAPCQRQHTQNAAHGSFAELAMHAAAERADLRTRMVGAAKQLLCAQRCMRGAVLVLDAMAPARVAQVLAQ
jgi:hypothetical protein